MYDDEIWRLLSKYHFLQMKTMNKMEPTPVRAIAQLLERRSELTSKASDVVWGAVVEEILGGEDATASGGGDGASRVALSVVVVVAFDVSPWSP